MIRLAALLILAVAFLAAACDQQETREPPPADQTATGAPAEATEETEASFQTLVDMANTHIRNGNFEAAETTLREMERMTPQLTEEMRKQIETVRAAINAARTGGASPDQAAPASQ